MRCCIGGGYDLDGRMEACDEKGDPSLFFTSADQTDVITCRDATLVEIRPPPYFGRCYYLDTLPHSLLFNDAAPRREGER